LTWHWGFIAAALVTCLIAVYFGISLLRLFDTLALPVTLGYGLMRLGCFLAGDGCYGKATDIALGVTFPNGLKPINTSVHPVSLYEGVIMLTFFLFGRYFLQGSRKGVLFSLVAILGGIERFSVEFMRLNPVVCLGLTAAQIISILLIFTGIGVFFWLTHGNSTSDLNIVSVGGYKP
jgi:phosphatidylglycerol:prolipoprotein diacylglycerol transferase